MFLLSVSFIPLLFECDRLYSVTCIDIRSLSIFLLSSIVLLIASIKLSTSSLDKQSSLSRVPLGSLNINK